MLHQVSIEVPRRAFRKAGAGQRSSLARDASGSSLSAVESRLNADVTEELLRDARTENSPRIHYLQEPDLEMFEEWSDPKKTVGRRRANDTLSDSGTQVHPQCFIFTG